MKDKGSQNRALIVDTANRLFYQKGYNQTSFNEIAEASGIPKGNFYYYFKSKDHILSAVIAARIARIKGTLEQWEEQYAAPEERLKRFVRMLSNSEKDLLRYGCPIGTLNMELAKSQRELQAEAAEMLSLFSKWLTRQFEALGRPKKAARSSALELLARAQGATLVANAFSDARFLEEQVRALEQWVEAAARPS